MYEIKNLETLKILQKAREFSDKDLSNEILVDQILKHHTTPFKQSNGDDVKQIFSTLMQAKEKAKMSNK